MVSVIFEYNSSYLVHRIYFFRQDRTERPYEVRATIVTGDYTTAPLSPLQMRPSPLTT